MYQKRKMGKGQNSNKEVDENNSKMNINCDITINGNRAVSIEISNFL